MKARFMIERKNVKMKMLCFFKFHRSFIITYPNGKKDNGCLECFIKKYGKHPIEELLDIMD